MDAAPWQSRLRRLVTWTPPRWALLGLLLLALVVRGRVMMASFDSLNNDPDGYRRVSANLMYDHVFSLYNFPPIPTAQRPPLYPLILAAIAYAVLPEVPHGYAYLNVILGVGTVWAVWRLGRECRLAPGTSLMAAALVAIDPLLLGQSVQAMTETLATFLATIALLALTRSATVASLRWTALGGALLGLCILCRPVFLVWLVLLAVAFALRTTGSQRALRLATLLAAAGLVLAPWTIRNYRQFGSPVVTTTHGGFTLLLANNPDFYEYLRGGSWGEVWDGQAVYDAQEDIDDPSKAHLEITIDRANYAQAFDNIRAEPGMFAWSCLVRLGRLWNVLPHRLSPDESSTRRGLRYAVAIFYLFEFALAAAGAWFLRGKLFAHPWLWGALLVLSITLVHAFYWTDMRMRAPLVPVVALAAAYGATLLACGRSVTSTDSAAP